MGLNVSVSRGVEEESREESRVTMVKVTTRCLALYPGESRSISVDINGPRSHIVSLHEQGFPRSVASIDIAPSSSRAPYTAKVMVAVYPEAKPGVYPWSLMARDVDTGKVLSEESLELVVMPRALPRELGESMDKLLKVYRRYGVQLALWLALQLFPKGAGFTTIKKLYELITGRSVSKGTVGNTLRMMIRKGLLEKLGNGLYGALDIDPKITLSRVDLKRVRYPWQVLKPEPTNKRRENTGALEEYRFRISELPAPIRRAYTYAQRIAREHGPLTAFYFVLHSLMGVRQTGYLLLWFNDWFLTLEPKTGFAHHFHSRLLHWMLQQLGLREGVYYKPESQQHREAQKTAQKYIQEFYGSHQSARRLHYMLWEKGYVWSDDEIYTVKVYHYLLTGDVGIQIFDKTGKEELYSENIKNEPARVEVYTALPYRHVDQRNEERYHYRPSGLY